MKTNDQADSFGVIIMLDKVKRLKPMKTKTITEMITFRLSVITTSSFSNAARLNV